MASLNHHLMLSQTQHLDQSPTPTPYPTRACSPVNAHHQPHSEEDAHTTMEKLRSMIQRQEPILPVNVVDGSVTVSNLTKFKYLAIYFAFNLGLTLYNKALMSQVCLCRVFLQRGLSSSSLLKSCTVFFSISDSGSCNALQALKQRTQVLYMYTNQFANAISFKVSA